MGLKAYRFFVNKFVYNSLVPDYKVFVYELTLVASWS